MLLFSAVWVFVHVIFDLCCCFFLHNVCFLQVDAQLQVVRKLEEKERLLQGTISTAERELALRTQALEMNKRKVNIRMCCYLQGYVNQENF